jgi:Phage tail protein
MRSTQQGQWRELFYGPGTDYPLSEIVGIDDMAPIRTADVPRPQIDGDWTGTDLVAPRTIVMTLGIRGRDALDLEAKRKAAMFRLSPSRRDTERLVLTDGRIVYAKLRRYSMPTDMGYDWRIGEIHLEFYCPDPRVYTGDSQSATLIAGGARLTGRTYKRGYTAASGAPNYVAPKGWQYPPGSQIVSQAQLTNTGNVPAPVDCTLTGPLLNPAIEVVGKSLFPINVSLGATDVLRVTRDYHVILNGVERRDLIGIGAQWPVIPPGTWTIRLFAQSGNGTCFVTTQSAVL